MSRRGLASAVGALVAVGCSPGADRPAAAALPPVTCTLSYRAAVTEPLEPSEVIGLRPGDSSTVDLEEVTIAVTYELSEGEGGALWVDALVDGSEDPLARTLYQFGTEPPPAGVEFAGGHGFTGLTYVHPPGTSAEVQYWCAVAGDG